MKYKVLITQGDFLEPQDFVEKYSKKGVEAVVENVEFEGTDNVHTSGYTVRNLMSFHFPSLSDEIRDIFYREDLRGECFGVYFVEDENLETELYTEEDFEWWA